MLVASEHGGGSPFFFTDTVGLSNGNGRPCLLPSISNVSHYFTIEGQFAKAAWQTQNLLSTNLLLGHVEVTSQNIVLYIAPNWLPTEFCPVSKFA